MALLVPTSLEGGSIIICSCAQDPELLFPSCPAGAGPPLSLPWLCPGSSLRCSPAAPALLGHPHGSSCHWSFWCFLSTNRDSCSSLPFQLLRVLQKNEDQTAPGFCGQSLFSVPSHLGREALTGFLVRFVVNARVVVCLPCFTY